MILLVKVMGIFAASMGLMIIINPEVTKGVIAYWQRGTNIYAVGLLRVILGVVFLLSVPHARNWEAIFGLGVILLLSALLLFALGLGKAKEILDWWGKRPHYFLRLMGILACAIGVLIIYSA
jgi:hypothetical protein